MNRTTTRQARQRTGVTAIESAIVLPILIVILFAILDLGLLVVRQNTLSVAADHLGRKIAMSGSSTFASGIGILDSLGPDPMSGSFANVFENEGLSKMVGLEPDDVEVNVQWTDGDNQSGQRAVVRLTYIHQSLLSSVAPWDQTELVATTPAWILN